MHINLLAKQLINWFFEEENLWVEIVTRYYKGWNGIWKVADIVGTWRAICIASAHAQK